LLFDETVSRGRSRKLSAQLLGLYTVTEVGKVNATIDMGRKLVKVLLDGVRKRVTPRNCLLQMWREILTLLFWVISNAAERDTGYKIDVYQETPGL